MSRVDEVLKEASPVIDRNLTHSLIAHTAGNTDFMDLSAYDYGSGNHPAQYKVIVKRNGVVIGTAWVDADHTDRPVYKVLEGPYWSAPDGKATIDAWKRKVVW